MQSIIFYCLDFPGLQLKNGTWTDQKMFSLYFVFLNIVVNVSTKSFTPEIAFSLFKKGTHLCDTQKSFSSFFQLEISIFLNQYWKKYIP